MGNTWTKSTREKLLEIEKTYKNHENIKILVYTSKITFLRTGDGSNAKGAIDSHRGWVKLEGGNRLAPASLPRIRERAIGLAPQIVKLQGGNRIHTLDSHHGRAIDLQGGGAGNRPQMEGAGWEGGY